MYEFLLCFGLLLWVGVGGWYATRPCASAFHPASYYLLFHGLVFVVRPIFGWCYDYRELYRVYEFVPSEATRVTVLLGADLGFVVFMAAALWWGDARPRLAGTWMTPAYRRQAVRAFLAVAALCVPVALWSTLHILDQKINGTGTMVMAPGTGIAINTTESGYWRDAALMLLPVLVFGAWLARFRWVALVPLAAAVALRAATGSRWPFVVALVSLALFHLFERRRRWFGASLVAGAAALALLFVTIGDDRGAALRAWFGGAAAERIADQRKPLETMDFANMEFFEYLVNAIPEKTGSYGYFLNNLQVFTEPVPRKWWPGKPVGAPIQRYDLWRYGKPIGMTNSLPGEGWAQLGWAGIVLWCGLFGWGYGRLHNLFMRSRQTPLQVALYLTFLPLSINVFRDGSLLTVLKFQLFTLLPILLWALLMRFLLRQAPEVRPRVIVVRRGEVPERA